MKHLVLRCCLLAIAALVAACQPSGQVSTARASGPTATPTYAGPPGSISGSLMFPADSAPPLQVFAVDVDDSHRYYSTKTTANQLEFSIPDVRPGTYHLLAYVQAGFMTGDAKTLAGGYTNYVDCVLTPTPGCNDHSLVGVVVRPGQDITGIRVWDWYAPPGAFPPPPGG